MDEQLERVTLTRDLHLSSATCGILIARGEVFYTLELPWVDNMHNISCIPTGEYECEFCEKTLNFENVYQVKNVPDRDSILLHVGNFPRDTHGCILIGSGRNTENGNPNIVKSRMAVSHFNDLMGKKNFTLAITNLIKAAA